MKRYIELFVVMGICSLLFYSEAAASDENAMEWVRLVDKNMYLESASQTSSMTIHLPSGQERTFRMHSKIVGEKYALIEYLEPKRDSGTRYLKREESLWIYFPRQDRTMQIQGHMLRQGVQGGDMSFEDMTESEKWYETYDAEIVAETNKEVTVRLVAKDMSVSYPFRDLVINKESGLPVSILNSDASGNPIKKIIIKETKKYGKRVYPTITEIHSELTKNKWTSFKVESIKFDVQYNESDFTKRALEQ